MKHFTKIIAAVSALTASAAVADDQQDYDDTVTVLTFIDRLFNQGDATAVDEMVSPDYVQHNAAVEGGLDALKALTPVRNDNGNLPTRKVVLRVAADDRMVAVHSIVTDNDANDDADVPNITFVDIFRVGDDQMIVEHWDVIQLEVAFLPAAADGSIRLGNPTQWGPEPETKTPQEWAAAGQATEDYIDDDYLPRLYAYYLFNEPSEADYTDFFTQDMVQHAAYIAPGLEGLQVFKDNLHPEFAAKVRRWAIQGDLAIVHLQWTETLAERGSDFCGWNVADVLRFNEAGKVVEHWSVKARTACFSVNGNTPFDGVSGFTE